MYCTDVGKNNFLRKNRTTNHFNLVVKRQSMQHDGFTGGNKPKSLSCFIYYMSSTAVSSDNKNMIGRTKNEDERFDVLYDTCHLPPQKLFYQHKNTSSTCTCSAKSSKIAVLHRSASTYSRLETSHGTLLLN